MTTPIPNHEQRTLQVNDSGAWRNVFKFQGDNTDTVLRHVHALGEVTTGIKFRIVRGQHVMLHYWTKDKGWQAK